MTYLYLIFRQVLTYLYCSLLLSLILGKLNVFLLCRADGFLNPLSSSPGTGAHKVCWTAPPLRCSECSAPQGFIFPTPDNFRHNIPVAGQSNRPWETAGEESQTSAFYCSPESHRGERPRGITTPSRLTKALEARGCDRVGTDHLHSECCHVWQAGRKQADFSIWTAWSSVQAPKSSQELVSTDMCDWAARSSTCSDCSSCPVWSWLRIRHVCGCHTCDCHLNLPELPITYLT